MKSITHIYVYRYLYTVRLRRICDPCHDEEKKRENERICVSVNARVRVKRRCIYVCVCVRVSERERGKRQGKRTRDVLFRYTADERPEPRAR